MQSKQEQKSSPERHLYEYAVIRYVPRVEREEFVNVGLIMMCKRKRWLRVETIINAERILAMHPASDLDMLGKQLESFSEICQGKSPSSIATLEKHERFRWLTAMRSASITTSRPHPGLTDDLDRTFDRLLLELVR